MIMCNKVWLNINLLEKLHIEHSEDNYFGFETGQKCFSVKGVE